MATTIVGIGEMAVSDNPQDSIVTLGLGSCVALVVTHPLLRCGAVAHVALPCARWDQRKKNERPCAFYADQAVQIVFTRLSRFPGFCATTSEVSIVGGASTTRNAGMQVGTRNVDAILSALKNLKIAPKHQLTGGRSSRNVRLELNDGTIWIKEPNGPEERLSSLDSSQHKAA